MVLYRDTCNSIPKHTDSFIVAIFLCFFVFLFTEEEFNYFT